MFTRILSWLTGGFLDRALSSVDKYIQSTTDKERIKGDVVQAYYASKPSWMAAGGFWLMLMVAIPAAAHFAAVTLYSMFWCARCAYPQEWTIAALPPPMDEWQGWIIIACLGGAGAFAWKR